MGQEVSGNPIYEVRVLGPFTFLTIKWRIVALNAIPESSIMVKRANVHISEVTVKELLIEGMTACPAEWRFGTIPGRTPRFSKRGKSTDG